MGGRGTVLDIIPTMPGMNGDQIPTHLLPAEILIRLIRGASKLCGGTSPRTTQHPTNLSALNSLFELEYDGLLSVSYESPRSNITIACQSLIPQ